MQVVELALLVGVVVANWAGKGTKKGHVPGATDLAPAFWEGEKNQ